MAHFRPLAGVRVAITRPVGSGDALARRVRVLGGTPLSLPGSSLRRVEDAKAARASLRDALACDVAIFTSPAAVRFAQSLAPLHGRACVLAPGTGTARALQRAGAVTVECPDREDSEGLLALPVLRNVHGKRVGIVGAAGGRGLLEGELARRGARVVHALVYRRQPARLDHRHAQALLRHSRQPLYVLLSSAQAITNILHGLPNQAQHVLLAGTAVASSRRIADAAQQAGFARITLAASAHATAMLNNVIADINPC